MKQHPRTPLRAVALAGALTGAAAVLVSVTAAAGDRGPSFPLSVADAAERAEARFQAMDSDASGEISAAEFAAVPRPEGWRQHGDRGRPRHHWRGAHPDGGERSPIDAELFDRLDGDADGQLSREEFSAERFREARRTAVQAHRFERLDADGSGGLSRDELPDIGARLAELDADSDGTVTREEARAGHPRFSHPGGDRD